jgi:hypothetical protein
VLAKEEEGFIGLSISTAYLWRYLIERLMVLGVESLAIGIRTLLPGLCTKEAIP